MTRVSVVNKAVVAYFIEDLCIQDHFQAIRHFLLLEDGEFGHALASGLFSKVRLFSMLDKMNYH